MAEEAERLAEVHREDAVRAYLAGLVHDCARDLPEGVLLELVPPYLREEVRSIPEILHAFAAPRLLEERFNLHDFKVLRAVRWHATGCEYMSSLEKIVFVADIAEPGRDFPWATRIRETATSDLRLGYILALRVKMEYLLQTYGVIYIESVRSWNREIEILRRERKNTP